MRRGWTLIEVLIAMAILVIVFASTVLIFRAAANSWRKGQIRAERYQQARFIFERITREISSILPVSLSGPYCVGEEKEFYFIFSTPDAPASLMEVKYWWRESSEELMRSYQDSPDYDQSTFAEEETLCRNIVSLKFEYSAGKTWQDYWDSRPGAEEDGVLPKAIKIKFGIRDTKGENIENFESVVMIPAAVE